MHASITLHQKLLVHREKRLEHLLPDDMKRLLKRRDLVMEQVLGLFDILWVANDFAHTDDNVEECVRVLQERLDFELVRATLDSVRVRFAGVRVVYIDRFSTNMTSLARALTLVVSSSSSSPHATETFASPQ